MKGKTKNILDTLRDVFFLAVCIGLAMSMAFIKLPWLIMNGVFVILSMAGLLICHFILEREERVREQREKEDKQDGC